MGLKALAKRAAVVVAVGCLALGCTPQPGPGPTPTPSPTATPAPTPPETARERQERLDFEAAEKAYRTFRAELGRVLRAGGASKPTPVMNETASGSYLDNFVAVADAYKDTGTRDSGRERIGYVKRGGYSLTSLTLDVCEDSRGVETYRRTKYVGAGEVRTARLDVRKKDGSWKVHDGSGQKVTSCA